MNRVAADGAWCLCQHVHAEGAPAPVAGELVVVGRSGAGEPDLGEFTFKRWSQCDGGYTIEPMSYDPQFKPVPFDVKDADDLGFIARFIEVLHIDDTDIITASE